MANIYITEQGAVLRKTGDRLIVEKDDETLLDVPCEKVDNVLIFGNVQFTTQAVHEMFDHGIEMAILTRTGRLVGQITAPTSKNVDLRVAQFDRYRNEDFRLDLARTVVQGKVKNALNMMRGFAFNHPERNFTEEIEGIRSLSEQITGTTAIDVLMGMEGTAARIYFGGFGKMILSDFRFEGRRKHPATDPVNALLSFTYTLMFNEILGLLDGIGFDPYVGFFHAIEYGRASLASDLLEEFRASADRLSLSLLNNRVFKEEDFYRNPKGEGVYLMREALKRYFAQYEKYLNREFTHPETKETSTLRKCFRLQAERLAKVLKENVPYTCFNLEV
ncbi:MAG: CRISPR-associated endonuclease Cas1 [Syntrophorhabdus sp. PtaU1.Bin002]|nr:MAG: CRISPR-associated endonuclease Cas1 [Syntrophorhabdus sp. PtaU1.Bin002]